MRGILKSFEILTGTLKQATRSQIGTMSKHSQRCKESNPLRQSPDWRRYAISKHSRGREESNPQHQLQSETERNLINQNKDKWTSKSRLTRGEEKRQRWTCRNPGWRDRTRAWSRRWRIGGGSRREGKRGTRWGDRTRPSSPPGQPPASPPPPFRRPSPSRRRWRTMSKWLGFLLRLFALLGGFPLVARCCYYGWVVAFRVARWRCQMFSGH